MIAAHPGTASGDQRVQLAYWLTFSRAPSEAERQAASRFYSKFPVAPATGNAHGAETAAWTSFCRVLFASAEFRYVK